MCTFSSPIQVFTRLYTPSSNGMSDRHQPSIKSTERSLIPSTIPGALHINNECSRYRRMTTRKTYTPKACFRPGRPVLVDETRSPPFRPPHDGGKLPCHQSFCPSARCFQTWNRMSSGIRREGKRKFEDAQVKNSVLSSGQVWSHLPM